MLTAEYDAAIARGEIHDDPLQRGVVLSFQRVADALDRPVFSRRRDGDLRSAPAERLRQRVADIPGVPVRVPRLHRAALARAHQS